MSDDDLIVIDEFTYALHYSCIPVQDIPDALGQKPHMLQDIITKRYARPRNSSTMRTWPPRWEQSSTPTGNRRFEHNPAWSPDDMRARPISRQKAIVSPPSARRMWVLRHFPCLSRWTMQMVLQPFPYVGHVRRQGNATPFV